MDTIERDGIEIKVTWEGYVYEMMRCYEHLNNEGKKGVWENLMEIARMADRYRWMAAEMAANRSEE